MINWSLIECIRFAYYMTRGMPKVNRLLGVLRYNVFIIAYILGVSGELIGIYWVYFNIEKMPVSERPLTYLMPNAWNFAIDILPLIKYVVPLLYILLFPQLYTHMWAQRARFYQRLRKIE